MRTCCGPVELKQASIKQARKQAPGKQISKQAKRSKQTIKDIGKKAGKQASKGHITHACKETSTHRSAQAYMQASRQTKKSASMHASE